jgi:protein phosphatase
VVQIDFGAESNVGRVRKNNEDHFLIWRLARSLEPLMTNVPAEALPANMAGYGYAMLVADGMGGHAAGEVASRMAISHLLNLIMDASKWGRRIDEQEAKEVLGRMEGYYLGVHEALTKQAQSEPSLIGMGTTMTLAYSLCADLFIAHAGDSRACLFRNGTLHMLTHDHTLAQELADRGDIAPEAVSRHRFRNILTNVLGGHSGPVATDLQHLQLMDKDRLLLCTDGLTDMVDDAAISDVLARTMDSGSACRELVNLALEAGGRDNVTVVLARYAFPLRQQNAEGSA